MKQTIKRSFVGGNAISYTFRNSTPYNEVYFIVEYTKTTD